MQARKSQLDTLARDLGIDADDAALVASVTHSSYAAEHRIESNERLEFLGDAVVGLVIAERAYRELDLPEGGLAQVRQATVSEPSLAEAAAGCASTRRCASVAARRPAAAADGLAARRRLRGRRRGGLPRRGPRAARTLVLRTLDERFRAEARDPGASDAKSRLQEWSEAKGLGAPHYDVTGEGPGHERRFTATRPIAGEVAARGEGSSKKVAELAAARRGLEAARCLSCPRSRPSALRSHASSPARRSRPSTVTNGKLTKRHKSVKEFRALLEGRTVKSVGRLGKNLVIGLDSGNHLVVHLGMCGQLLRAKSAKDVKPKHTHVVIALTQGGELRYVDPRMFGELYVSIAPPEGVKIEVSPYAKLAVGGDGVALRGKVPELADLGIDPVEDVVGWDRFAAILRDRTTPLKALLTDQHVIAGIGNIYADEILYTAGLRYDRPSGSLSTIEVRRLHRSIGEVLAEAIKHGGSHAGRRAVRRPRRQARQLPGVPPRLRPRGRGVPPVPHADPEGHRARARHVLLPELPGVTGAAGDAGGTRAPAPLAEGRTWTLSVEGTQNPSRFAFGYTFPSPNWFCRRRTSRTAWARSGSTRGSGRSRPAACTAKPVGRIFIVGTQSGLAMAELDRDVPRRGELVLDLHRRRLEAVGAATAFSG